MTLNEEKLQLESKLAGVSKLEERLKEVYQLLGEDVSPQPTDDEADMDWIIEVIYATVTT